MADTAVRDGATNLAMAPAVADATHTVSVETQRFDLTVPSSLRPTQAEMGTTRHHPAESSDAGRRLQGDRPSLQSALEIPARDDGQ